MAGRQTALTSMVFVLCDCCHRNGWLFRGISSSSSILVSCTLSRSFIVGFLIDDKAIYVSLMSPPLLPSSPSHPSLSLPYSHSCLCILFYFFFPFLHFLSLSHPLSAHFPSLLTPLFVFLCFVHTQVSVIFSLHLRHSSSSSSSFISLPLTSFAPRAPLPFYICSILTYLHALHSAHHFFFFLPFLTTFPHIFFLSFYFSTFIFF